MQTRTALLLEAMTDRSKFEILATSILRKANPHYAPIIHTGVNAQGETIVAPLDGIHLIPGSVPPHYVFFLHTTYDRAGLRGKWLTGANADLPKAIAEAATVRQQIANAQFTVVLCSNQRLDVDLVRDVTIEAKKAGLDPDLWEQHRLADFLDNSADGHWLRKSVLGVEAELLSDDLLRQLCKMSVEAYRRHVLSGAGQVIERETVREVAYVVGESSIALCLLVGSSGFGKSVTALQCLELQLNRDGFALWLPPERIRDAAHIEGALDSWLRHLHPTVEQGAGASALRLVQAAGQRLVLVVDDVSRTESPPTLLRTLVALAAPPSAMSPNGASPPTSSRSSPVMVVPIWPEWVQHLPKTTLDSAWIKTISIGTLTEREGVNLIRLASPSLSTTEAAAFADRLANDPFLVGLFATLCREVTDTARFVALSEDVIGHFISTRLQELTSTPQRFRATELRDALVRLAREMLARRNLQPRWSEIAEWFGQFPQLPEMLRVILAQGAIAQLDLEGDFLVFRHDRLRERLLSNGMSRLLHESASSEDITADPYFASITGQALARDASLECWIGQLYSTSPLSLFEALRSFRVPQNEHQQKTVDAIRRWTETEYEAALPSLRDAISWTLLETDSPLVVELASSMPQNYLAMLAALRNGSAKLGVNYFSSSGYHDLEPATNDELRERIVGLAIACNCDQLAADIRAMVTPQELANHSPGAILALLGHLRLSGFDDEIRQLWASNQESLLAHACWAACLCPLADISVILDPFLDYLARLPKRSRPEDHSCLREKFVQELSWAFRRGISTDAVAHLISRAGRDGELRTDIAWLLDDVDHPDAVEFVVRQMADEGHIHFTKNLTGVGDGDLDIHPVSPESLARLKRIWECRSEAERVRTLAFTMWLQSGSHDLGDLRLVNRAEPFYVYALQHRIKLGDRAAEDEIIVQLGERTWGDIWWDLSHRVWGDKLQGFASEILSSLKDSISRDYRDKVTDIIFMLSRMLVKIPVAAAERLLNEHWGHLKYCPRMIQAALRIATPSSLELARDAILRCPAEVDLFTLASIIWEGRASNNPLTVRNLIVLEPYLDRMTQEQKLSLAWSFERVSDPDGVIAVWLRQHIVPGVTSEDRRRVRVADEHLLSDLDHQLNAPQFYPYLVHELRDPTNRHDFPQRQLQLLDRWLQANATLCGLRIAAIQIAHIGSREDVSLLTRYPIDGPPDAIGHIIADTTFAIRRRALT